MASEPGKQPAQQPRKRRRIGALPVLLVAVPLLLLAAGVWLFGTQSGARAAFSMLAMFAPEMVRAEGIRGRLTGPLRLDRLTLDLPGQLITLQNLQLDWEPKALLDRQLHVSRLSAAQLSVSQKEREQTEPSRLPENISLPLKLRLDSVEVGRGEIMKGPVSLMTLGPAGLHLDFDGARYLLRVDRLAARSAAQVGSFVGDLKGEASLAVEKPYALHAQFASGAEVIVGQETVGATGRIDAEGTLEELALTTDLTIRKSKIAGRTVLRPFSQQPLGVTNLTAQAFDLSAFKADLPRTGLDVDLTMTAIGEGKLTVANAQAGPYNDKKLPLVDLLIAFRQQAGQFDFDRISINLGAAKQPGGSISGKGRYANGALVLDLALRSIDLKRLDQRMQPTRLAGQVGLRHASGRQEFNVEISEPLKNRRSVALLAEGGLAGSALTISRAEVRLGDGRARLAGHVDLAGGQSFDASGDIARFRLRDIGDFKQLPDLFLNGGFTVRGVRQPQLFADIAFKIENSRLEGHPLQGDGKAQLRPDSIDISRFQLAAGANRLGIEGRLTQNEGQLSFTLDAPKLEQMGPGFAGVLQANGSVRGSFDRPRINASWSGKSVRIADLLQLGEIQGKADIEVDRGKPLFFTAMSLDAQAREVRRGTGKEAERVGSLSAQVRFAPQAGAPLDIAINAQGLIAGGINADSLIATAKGTTGQHGINVTLNEAGQSWALAADGGLRALESAPQWQGSIQRFDAAGRFAGRLESPSPLLVSQHRTQLERFRFNASAGLITVEQFIRDDNGISTRGSIERLQVGQVLRFTGKEPALKTDLQLRGDWDMKLADTPSGKVRIRRESGDVQMLGSRPVPLGLRELEATADISGGQLALQLRADGKQLGLIDANGRIGLSGGNRLAPAPDAPVTADIRIDIPSLGWAGTLVSPTTLIEGRLQSAIAIGGTLAEPQLRGKISGNDLRYLSMETGIDLRNGVLESEFRDAQLVLRSLRFPSGDGQLVASGIVDLSDRQPTADIAIKAERFAVLDRSDRRLRISGDSRINWRQAQAKVSGAFSVDSGFVDISSTSMPRLSDDVVIVGRSTQAERKPAERGLPAAIDVAIDLGKGVVLKGRGLDALLGGQVRLVSQVGEPLGARGTLRIIKGTFAAYGRELAIEHGLLRFNGPIENPSLDILAMRHGQEVEAGVAVLGSVLSPRVTLVSEPPVSEAEKLSWLVLGHGLESAGQGELGKLQSSAGALLSRGAAAGIESQIGRAFGLDQFSVGTTQQDGLEQRIVTLGKQVSSRLYVSVEQGLQTASSVLHMRYVLSPKLTLEAEAGTRSALSLFYNISFD